MSQFLYKKGSLKNLKKTIFKLNEDCVLRHVYEVTAIAILNYNIDGVGSAIVEKCEIEVVDFSDKYDILYREAICKNSKYVIMSYSKLEEIMLSPEWIVSDYFSSDKNYPIEEILKTGSHATKED